MTLCLGIPRAGAMFRVALGVVRWVQGSRFGVEFIEMDQKERLRYNATVGKLLQHQATSPRTIRPEELQSPVGWNELASRRTRGIDDQPHIITCSDWPPHTLVEGVEVRRHRPPHGVVALTSRKGFYLSWEHRERRRVLTVVPVLIFGELTHAKGDTVNLGKDGW